MVDAGHSDHVPSPGVRGAGLTPGVRGVPVVSQLGDGSLLRAQAAPDGLRKDLARRLGHHRGTLGLPVAQAALDGLSVVLGPHLVPAGRRSRVSDSDLLPGIPTAYS